MPILSIIVPVYNAADRIGKCIRSIQDQTLQEIEIIIVNDGSTDESYRILEKLGSVDGRVKLLNFPNGGAAAARNRGLEVAVGKYVGFVDADDWIEAQMFEKLIATIEADQTDIVVCDIIKEFNDTTQMVLNLSKHEILSERLLQKLILMEFDYSLCNKLYKRDLIVQNALKFEEGLRLSQDALFNMSVFACIHSLSLIPGAFYHYVKKENSLMSSPQEKRIESFNQIIRSFKSFCRERNKEHEWRIFERYIGQGYQKYLFNLVLKSPYTNMLDFTTYYEYVLRNLKLMDPLLLIAPLEGVGKYQRFRKGLLQKRRFKIFSLLAAIRHKVVR